MCEECYRVSCDASCPFAADAERRVTCEVCGEPLFSDADFFARGRRCICAECVENLTVDDLLTLTDLRDVSDLLESFGYRRVL